LTMYVPARHRSQSTVLVLDEYLPGSQSTHVKTEVAPVAAEYLPA
jgi:hypothetical protein